MTMGNRIYIEIAFCKPKRFSIIGGIKNISNLYDVVAFSKDLEKEYDIPKNLFIKNLVLRQEHKYWISAACHYISEYVTNERILEKERYDIVHSYAYFAIVDENGETIYSTPYMTSPLLFNPNDEDMRYYLTYSTSKFMYKTKITMNSEKVNLIKHIDSALTVRQLEDKLVRHEITTHVTPTEVANSLLDYHEELPIGSVRSIYEDVTVQGLAFTFFANNELKQFVRYNQLT